MAKSVVRRLSPYASHLLKEKGGNVAVLFALSATVLSLTAALAIDVSRINSAKDALDRVSDAAALAAKRTESKNMSLGTDQARAAAQTAATNFFNAQIPGMSAYINNPTFNLTWDADGAARMVSTGQAPMVFAGLLGRPYVLVTSRAVATEGADSELEIALLLDTTASMFQLDGRPTTRFTLLRQASKDFVNQIYDNVTVADKVRIAVVPWTTTVNIKSEVPGAWNAAAGGLATVADKGSQVLPASTINRNANISNSANLATEFAPVGWRGCIAGTGETLTADDSIKTGMTWDALRIREELRNRSLTNQYKGTGTCSTSCPPPPKSPGPPPPPKSPSPPASPPPPPPPPTQGSIERLDRMFAFAGKDRLSTELAQTCTVTTYSCDQCRNFSPSTSATGKNCTPDDQNGAANAYVPVNTSCLNSRNNVNHSTAPCALTYSTILPCVRDPNEITYNNAGGRQCSWVPATAWTSHEAIVGPNLNCPMPMLGLSGSRPQIMATIDRLSPSPGGTHADVGLRWGLRALSPREEWSTFFGTTRAPGAFGANSTARKMMVLITDGANEQAIDYAGYWGCNQTSNGICTGAPDRATLDQRMLDWCSAIRNTYNIELYTVAVNVTDATAVNLLAQCAGDPSRAFSGDAGELGTAFAAIARDAFQLRLKE